MRALPTPSPRLASSSTRARARPCASSRTPRFLTSTAQSSWRTRPRLARLKRSSAPSTRPCSRSRWPRASWLRATPRATSSTSRRISCFPWSASSRRRAAAAAGAAAEAAEAAEAAAGAAAAAAVALGAAAAGVAPRSVAAAGAAGDRSAAAGVDADADADKTHANRVAHAPGMNSRLSTVVWRLFGFFGIRRSTPNGSTPRRERFPNEGSHHTHVPYHRSSL
mmetsp:Transcript_3674/g.16862  ORF Transcript_3674/g.16862 Transcript_3674/m.16862 type:complete len:223 (+) Transcript_3674:1117-1785(+)